MKTYDNLTDHFSYRPYRHLALHQSAIYDRKREKREKAQAARDLEYHEKRMADFK